MAFALAVLTSAAVLLEDISTRAYRLRHIVRLLALGPLELVVYRPILMWARYRGTVGFLRNEKGWDKFDRNERDEPALGGAIELERDSQRIARRLREASATPNQVQWVAASSSTRLAALGSSANRAAEGLRGAASPRSIAERSSDSDCATSAMAWRTKARLLTRI